MITVHHLNNSRSQRILWLLEELELPYEIKFYERDPKTMLAPKALKDIHPLGKSPVLTEDGNVIAESAAIIEYILKKYDTRNLKPKPGTSEDQRFTYWLHYSEGSAMPPLLLKLLFSRLPKQPMPFFIRPIISAFSKKVLKNYVDPQIKLHMNFLENELKKNIWFAGNEFSAADIQMSFPIEAAASRGIIDSTYPNLKTYLRNIHARTAYKKALQKGGPYALLN